jgi:pre-mRNA-processing factor 40
MQRRVYDMHLTRLRQQAADEARRAERKRRHRIDDLRYALKSVGRHIDLEMSYEEAVPFMRELKEWEEVKEEGDRREAFEKFVKRQKVGYLLHSVAHHGEERAAQRE